MLINNSKLITRIFPLLVGMRRYVSSMINREYAYSLPNHICLTVTLGSVLDFSSKNGAIVNAANEECLGGGGVDGAITSAGGPNLAADRKALPKVEDGIRCKTGSAVITGPGEYGELKVPYVIHAVGPNYMMFNKVNDIETPNQLLRSAYQSSLDRAAENSLEKIGFCLLSAGVFSGNQSVESIIGIGVQGIHDWCQDQPPGKISLKEVYMYGFNEKECDTLRRVCDKILTPGSDKTSNSRNLRRS